MDTFNSEKTISLWDDNSGKNIVLRNLRNGKRYSFTLKHSFIVGSKKECCDLQITTDDHYMSRKHLRFVKGENVVYIEDMHTTNGTSVNGKQIVSRTRIKKGDILKLGRTEFEVTI